MGDYGAVLQNQPVDASEEFARQTNHYFVGERVEGFDPASGSGEILWKSLSLKQRVSYHQLTLQFEDFKLWEDTPPNEYQDDQTYPFSLSFVTPRTVRLRVAARPPNTRGEHDPLILDGKPPTDDSWTADDDGERATYVGPFGSVVVERDPLHFEFRDASGGLLTRTQHLSDTRSVVNSMPTPFSFARNPANLHRHVAASFSLAPDEMLFGGGESFTRLNKRGQKMVLWTYDAYSAQTPFMYKPVPFFVSSRGYGMFVHTSAPLTFDFGHSYDGANVVYLGDDFLDLFFFVGSPKAILSEYTALTGRATTPPLWSFGLWMGQENESDSEEGTREVAGKLRGYGIPSDVIHLDVGWTEVPHRCDFEFSPSRFPDPEKMLSDLKEQGFRVSLWQLPYFNPMNELHGEAIEKGHVVLSANGKPPVDDAVIDLSSPDAVGWYKEKLRALLRKGVAVFTADFGEAAPFSGIYHKKSGGFHEHNLYPLRYNAVVTEATEEVTGEPVIWARSAWAGSQRYPLHWGGDAETTDSALAATLRAGLSLGLCGFSFWGHFIGGFSTKSPPDLYLRWLAFGVLCSHTRCHGAPPRMPWEYGEEFTDEFRRIVETKYRLMPYVYSQARRSSELGHPMIRPLFFEYPEDRTSWFIEDEYLFGNDLLVAPLLGEARDRDVYLPPGVWIDYQSGDVYRGAGWRGIRAGEVPVVLLVRDGAAIPHAELARHTGEIDWSDIEIVVFAAEATTAEGLFCAPGDEGPRTVRLKLDPSRDGGTFDPRQDLSGGAVAWKVRVAPPGTPEGTLGRDV